MMHKKYERLIAFAIDHRQQFIDWANTHNRDLDAIAHFKQLAYQAAQLEAQDDDGFGMLIDAKLGQTALDLMTDSGAWIGRPIEVSGQFPLQFDTDEPILEHLAKWPKKQTVKVLCPYRLDDDEEIRAQHEQLIIDLYHACQATDHEFLFEIITARKGNEPDFDSVPSIMQKFYDLGVKPNWWKIEPGKNKSYWQQAEHIINENDPNCQGIIVLGLDGSIASIGESFNTAAPFKRVKGFAVGRTFFSTTAQAWLAGNIDDDSAMIEMRSHYRAIIDAWDAACTTQTEQNLG